MARLVLPADRVKPTNTMRIVLTAVLIAGCAPDGQQLPQLNPNLAVDVASLRCDTPASGCAPTAIEIHTFGSQFQVETRLAGAWQFCGGADDKGRFGAGLELTPDHELYVLQPAEDGSCRRATEGSPADWYTMDISEQNPQGTYELVLAWPDGWSTLLVPAFSRSTSRIVDGAIGFEFGKLHPQ